jgi:hypothetical protein
MFDAAALTAYAGDRSSTATGELAPSQARNATSPVTTIGIDLLLRKMGMKLGIDTPIPSTA